MDNTANSQSLVDNDLLNLFPGHLCVVPRRFPFECTWLGCSSNEDETEILVEGQIDDGDGILHRVEVLWMDRPGNSDAETVQTLFRDARIDNHDRVLMQLWSTRRESREDSNYARRSVGVKHTTAVMEVSTRRMEVDIFGIGCIWGEIWPMLIATALEIQDREGDVYVIADRLALHEVPYAVVGAARFGPLILYIGFGRKIDEASKRELLVDSAIVNSTKRTPSGTR